METKKDFLNSLCWKICLYSLPYQQRRRSGFGQPERGAALRTGIGYDMEKAAQPGQLLSVKSRKE